MPGRCAGPMRAATARSSVACSSASCAEPSSRCRPARRSETASPTVTASASAATSAIQPTAALLAATSIAARLLRRQESSRRAALELAAAAGPGDRLGAVGNRRGGGGSRVERHPADAVEIDLDPGVRVEVADREAAPGPHSGGEATYHAAWDPDHPQHQRHRPGELLAIADPVAEEEGTKWEAACAAGIRCSCSGSAGSAALPRRRRRPSACRRSVACASRSTPRIRRAQQPGRGGGGRAVSSGTVTERRVIARDGGWMSMFGGSSFPTRGSRPRVPRRLAGYAPSEARIGRRGLWVVGANRIGVPFSERLAHRHALRRHRQRVGPGDAEHRPGPDQQLAAQGVDLESQGHHPLPVQGCPPTAPGVDRQVDSRLAA